MGRLPLKSVAPLAVLAIAGLASGADRATDRRAPAPDPLGASFSLEARGLLKEAVRASREAAERKPAEYFPRLRTAYLELKLKQFGAAADDYARAATLAPRSVEPLLGRQQALVELGKYRDAEAVAREVLARDADNYLGSSRLAWTLYSMGRYAEAAQVYARVLTLYPGDLEMMTGLGYAELKAGRKSEAAEAFRAVLAIVSSHARARQGLALCR
jgi:tetratricopeptide (TPR) repeat protein